MICSRCNYEIPNGFKFCPQCGRFIYIQLVMTICTDRIKQFKEKFNFLFRKPKIFIPALLLILIMICLSGNYVYQKSEFSLAGKIAKIQKQQEAFTAWRSKLSDELKKHDEQWESWGKTLDSLNKNDLSLHEMALNLELASVELNSLSNIMYIEAKSINRLKAPEELLKDHRTILNDAIENIYVGILSRREACEIMKNACTYGGAYSASTLSKVNEEMEYSNSYFAKAMLGISSVQLELESLKNDLNKSEK